MKQTVYIASPESQQIHVWNLNHEGALTLTQVVDVPGQVQPMAGVPEELPQPSTVRRIWGMMCGCCFVGCFTGEAV